MTIRKHGRIGLTPERLLRIYRQLESNPLKIFSNKELGIYSPQREKIYLLTLARLGLIEKVPCVYNTGARLLIRRNMMGWRIKK